MIRDRTRNNAADQPIRENIPSLILVLILHRRKNRTEKHQHRMNISKHNSTMSIPKGPFGSVVISFDFQTM